MFIKVCRNRVPKSWHPRAPFLCAIGSTRHTFISMYINVAIDVHQSNKLGENQMANSKKSATVRPNLNVYTLSTEAKKSAPKDIKAATHKGALLLALRKLGSAPFAAILAEVQKQ